MRRAEVELILSSQSRFGHQTRQTCECALRGCVGGNIENWTELV